MSKPRTASQQPSAAVAANPVRQQALNAWVRQTGRRTRSEADRTEAAEDFTDYAFSWQRISVQMLPEMYWQLKARAAQERTSVREVLHRAIVAYLNSPLPASTEPR
jgi:hypothetical protein